MKCFSKENCHELLRNVSPSNELVEYEVIDSEDKIVGYMADHQRLLVAYKEDNGKIFRKQLFVKILPYENESQLGMVKEMQLFEKEAKVYKNLIVQYLKYVSKPFAPSCYFANDDLIVLDDLALQGFKVSNEYYLTEKQCFSVVETLARFHACTFIFEHKESTKLSDIFNIELKETTFSYEPGHVRYEWLKNVSNCVGDLVMLFTDKPVKNALIDYTFNELKELVRSSPKYKNVLTHDDVHMKNIMFNDQNHSILVDYQLTRYAPPVFDLLLFIYLEVDEITLKNNFNNLLETYFSSLIHELKKSNIPETVYTKEEFLETIEVYTIPALMEAAFYGTVTYVPEELCQDILGNSDTYQDFFHKNRSPYVMNLFKTNEVFRKKISRIIKPLVKFFEMECREL